MDLSHLGDSGTSGALAEWGCVCTHAGEGDGQEGQGHWVWLWPWCGLVHGEGTARKGVDTDFVLQSQGKGKHVEGTVCAKARRPPGPPVMTYGQGAKNEVGYKVLRIWAQFWRWGTNGA